MRNSTSVSELFVALKLAEYALALTKRTDYKSEAQFKTALAVRRKTIKDLKARLWDLTHKSKYVLRPDVEL